MTRINERIRAPKVRVIDGETNAQLGVLSPAEAIQIARSRGLDLVEVAAEAKPPVCKIISYGKWKYEQSKHNKDKGKQKGGKVKEVKFRINISDNDYKTKMMHGEEFLDHNNKLRIILQFRGREVAHPEIGMKMMHKIIDDLKTMSHVDMSPRQSGRSISMTLSPLAQHLRHRKFEKPKGDEILDVEDDDDDEDDEDEEDDSPESHVHTLPLEDILSEMEEDDGRPKKRH
ncbi:MAG TPA: translation initiation factor IF-3 [Verrucomicrobiales bacterium]|jgi:translation initiation factor IF-3|nr:translation initiation factor IF-3 [Verrucomicrobiales bacterium]